MGLGLSNPTHILFIGIVLLLVFGAKRLPEMGQSLGAGMRGFKESLTGEDSHHDPLAELTASPAVAVSATPAATAPVVAGPASESAVHA